MLEVRFSVGRQRLPPRHVDPRGLTLGCRPGRRPWSRPAAWRRRGSSSTPTGQATDVEPRIGRGVPRCGVSGRGRLRPGSLGRSPPLTRAQPPVSPPVPVYAASDLGSQPDTVLAVANSVATLSQRGETRPSVSTSTGNARRAACRAARVQTAPAPEQNRRYLPHAARVSETTGRCARPSRYRTSSASSTPGRPRTGACGRAQRASRGHRARGSKRGR